MQVTEQKTGLENIDVFVNSKISIKTWNLIYLVLGIILGLVLSVYITIISIEAIRKYERDRTVVYNMTDLNNNKINFECYLKDVDNCKCENVTYKEYNNNNMDIMRCNNYFAFLNNFFIQSKEFYIIFYIIFGYPLTIIIVMVLIVLPLLLCVAHILKCYEHYQQKKYQNLPSIIEYDDNNELCEINSFE